MSHLNLDTDENSIVDSADVYWTNTNKNLTGIGWCTFPPGSTRGIRAVVNQLVPISVAQCQRLPMSSKLKPNVLSKNLFNEN